MATWLRAFALEAGRLGSILSWVKPKTLKLVSAVTLAKRSAIKCSAEDEMNREQKYVSKFLTKCSRDGSRVGFFGSGSGRVRAGFGPNFHQRNRAQSRAH